MDYKKIHDSIIENSVARGFVDGYFERHHVIPKSMGGKDDKSNIVNLNAREHYLIHWLLFKIHRNKETCFAWYRMTHCRGGVIRYSSRTFDYAKKHRAIQVSELFSGKKLTEEHIKKLSNAKQGKTYADMGRKDSPLKGRNISDDHKIKIGLSSKGRVHSEPTKNRMSESKIGEKNHRYGATVSDETRAKLRQSAINARKIPMSDETRKKLSDAMKKARALKHWSSRESGQSKN